MESNHAIENEKKQSDFVVSGNYMWTNRAIHCLSCGKEFSSQMGDLCPWCGYPVFALGLQVKEILSEVENFRKAAGITCCDQISAAGDLFEMGQYRSAPIQWRVLAVEEGKALLISEKGLDCLPYHYEQKEISWKDSAIREWVNGSFLRLAFSEEERERILPVSYTELIEKEPEDGAKADAESDKESYTEPVIVTDTIFLLSLEELRKYFPSADKRGCLPTEYSIGRGMQVDSSTGFCRWWLRTMSRYPDRAESVMPSGSIGISMVDKMPVLSETVAVRPAMWIEI